MVLRGNSTGNGAGCPIRFAEAVENSNRFVKSMNSCFSMVFSLPPSFSCFVLGSLKEPLEKTRMYSWMSRRQGFDADCQDPHAVLAPADADLSQITSPRMRKPNSIIIVFT